MPRRSHVIALLVLAAGLAVSAAMAGLLFAATQGRDRQAFEADADVAQAAVLERIETSIALLRGAAGLFASQQDNVTPASFRAYMERVALREQYPGILGIGFSRRVPDDEREPLVGRLRAQGHPGFRIWPDGARDEVHAIVFLEPMDRRNSAAIGYDMYTNPVRREAMARARDDGHAVASGVVELVQEIDERKQPGFLIYLPVYRGGATPASVEARREQLVGFAYAPIRSVDFLSSAFAHEAAPRVAFDVRHGGADGVLLYARAPADPPAVPQFTLTRTVTVADQPWTFAFRSSRSFASTLVVPALAGATGALLSLALAALLWRGASARAAVQAALEREQVARSAAERANRMKDDFLATLSHEMRTPLNAIVGWAAVLKLDRLADAERRAGIDAIDRNAKAQARLIDDLLDMNRVMSGKLRMNVERVALAQVVEDAVDAVLPGAQEKGVLVVQAPVGPPLFVDADAARLQQVIWNLLSNAIKFTPAGGEVRVTLERDGNRARVVVADTGEGMAPEFVPSAFDRFSQGDSTSTRHHGGLGLGLAIVRELVALHHGSVRAHSDGPGKGATFVVELPLAAEPEASASPKVQADAMLDGLRVLVVDDEPDVRSLLQLVLEQRHALVACAASAREALALVPTFRPDVLVSDIGMPETNGYELMRSVARLPRGEGGDLPAVALTAYAREQDRKEAFAAGFRRHLVKPVAPGLLAVTVRGLADEARAA